jgi:hypothetical protein
MTVCTRVSPNVWHKLSVLLDVSHWHDVTDCSARVPPWSHWQEAGLHGESLGEVALSPPLPQRLNSSIPPHFVKKKLEKKQHFL